DGLASREAHPPGGGVQRREEPVLDAGAGVGQPVEQRGLPGVRVADERGGGESTAAPGFALRGAGPAEALQVLLELGDPPLDAAPVDLELGLAGTAGPDPAALLAEADAASPQARHPVSQLGELHLEHA